VYVTVSYISLDLLYIHNGDEPSENCNRTIFCSVVYGTGERRGAYKVLVGKPEGQGPLVRPRRSWEDNIKMDLQEVGCGGMD